MVFTGDYVYLSLEDDRAILEPVSLIEEFDDLIARDVEREGYTGSDVAAKVKEKKLLLLKALDDELRENLAEAAQDRDDGKSVTLWPPKG